MASDDLAEVTNKSKRCYGLEDSNITVQTVTITVWKGIAQNGHFGRIYKHFLISP